jgi:hypothetical protein
MVRYYLRCELPCAHPAAALPDVTRLPGSVGQASLPAKGGKRCFTLAVKDDRPTGSYLSTRISRAGIPACQRWQKKVSLWRSRMTALLDITWHTKNRGVKVAWALTPRFPGTSLVLVLRLHCRTVRGSTVQLPTQWDFTSIQRSCVGSLSLRTSLMIHRVC